MALSEGIKARLGAVAGVTAITSNIFCGDTPQSKAPPRIEIHELNLDPMLTLDGTSGMRSADIDIDCKAVTLVAAHSLADAVEAAFNDFSGSAGDVTIRAVMLQDRGDSTEPPDTGSNVKLYVTTLDYQVQFEQ